MRALLVLLIAAASCASNPYQTYFHSTYDNGANGLMPWSGRVQVVEPLDVQDKARELRRRGFQVVGTSQFETGQAVTTDQIIEVGRAVHADIVVHASEFIGTRTGTMSIPTYQPGRSTTTQSGGVATVYGPGGNYQGSVNYGGQTRTVEDGSWSSTAVPVTVDRYAHIAVFWRKAMEPVFGASVVRLPDDLRHQLGRNAGVLVVDLVDDSPAFRGNVLIGDVITAFDSDEVSSPDDFVRQVDAHAGKTCKLSVLRDGQETVLTLRLNPRPQSR